MHVILRANLLLLFFNSFLPLPCTYYQKFLRNKPKTEENKKLNEYQNCNS